LILEVLRDFPNLLDSYTPTLAGRQDFICADMKSAINFKKEAIMAITITEKEHWKKRIEGGFRILANNF